MKDIMIVVDVEDDLGVHMHLTCNCFSDIAAGKVYAHLASILIYKHCA